MYLVEDEATRQQYALKRMSVNRDDTERQAIARWELEVHVRVVSPTSQCVVLFRCFIYFFRRFHCCLAVGVDHFNWC